MRLETDEPILEACWNHCTSAHCISGVVAVDAKQFLQMYLVHRFSLGWNWSSKRQGKAREGEVQGARDHIKRSTDALMRDDSDIQIPATRGAQSSRGEYHILHTRCEVKTRYSCKRSTPSWPSSRFPGQEMNAVRTAREAAPCERDDMLVPCSASSGVDAITEPREA